MAHRRGGSRSDGMSASHRSAALAAVEPVLGVTGSLARAIGASRAPAASINETSSSISRKVRGGLGTFDAHPALACRIALRERSGRGGLYRARDGGGEQHCADHRERRGGGDLGRSSCRWPQCSTSLTLGPEGRMEDGVISARGPEETDPIAASTNRMVSAESRVRARPEGRRTRRSGSRSCPLVGRSADVRDLGGAAERPSPGLV